MGEDYHAETTHIVREHIRESEAFWSPWRREGIDPHSVAVGYISCPFALGIYHPHMRYRQDCIKNPSLGYMREPVAGVYHPTNLASSSYVITILF
jgi:hypothetical protein